MSHRKSGQGNAYTRLGIVRHFLYWTTLVLVWTHGGDGANVARALDAPGRSDISASNPGMDDATMARVVRRAEELRQLHALIVARNGTVGFERSFRGPGLDVPVNIKSVSKAIISALVGIAIDRGLLKGPDQAIVALLGDSVPTGTDPKLRKITIGHLLSMQAGLERTSGANYGRWVNSRDWVRYVLSRPFVDEPGGRMLYSTGNSHVLSALLTQVSGKSTLDLARGWLGEPLGFNVIPWDLDPQGIYLGGNNMLLSPRALLRFGEMYRNGGTFNGRRILVQQWVRASWTPRTNSFFSGDGYGYGWFITEACGQSVHYARGYGGQFLYIVPSLSLTIVITSQTTVRTRVGGYYSALRSDIIGELIAAALRADAAALRGPVGEHSTDATRVIGQVPESGCAL